MAHDNSGSGPPAPEGLVSPPHVAAAWPRPEDWPAADAHPSVFVRFYRDRLGWICRPTPGPLDVISYARSLLKQACEDHRSRYGAEPPEDAQVAFWDDAREIAEKARKGPIGYTLKARLERAEDLADERVDAWWGKPGDTGREAERKAARGACIAPGRSSRGFPAVLSDVDPRHGGDLQGPWGEGLPGPASVTPGGGRHTLLLGTGAERNSGGRAGVAPGVDIIASGTTILVPAGSATPDRRWVSVAPPVVAPEALRQAPRWTAPGTPAGAAGGRHGGGASEWTGTGGSGRAAHFLRTPAHDGDREDALKAIVGVLARCGACPPDVVEASLEVLLEVAVGEDWDRERIGRETARWRTALTRGPRDADFAADVMEFWAIARNMAGGKWRRPMYARMKARNFWRMISRHQEGEVGTIDHGYDAEGVGDDFDGEDAPPPPPAVAPPAPAPAPPKTPTGEAPAGNGAAPPAAPTPAPPPAVDVLGGPTEQEMARRVDEAALRRLLPTLSQAYPREQRLKDYARRPLRVDALFPFADFATGNLVRDGGPGHGMGRWFAAAFGGLAAGDAKVLGAPGSKSGKTHFVGQMVEGLALGTAARIIGDPDYAHAPIVLPVWVSEMPKEGEIWQRMVSRHCGFDLACIAEGEAAEDARGVAHMANAMQWTAHDVVRRARFLADWYDDHPDDSALGFALRYLVREIDLSALPAAKGQGRFRQDPRSGPELIARAADAAAVFRRDLAALLSLPEDDVLLLFLLDPTQRFCGEDVSAKAAIDSLLSAAVTRVCRRRTGLGGVLLATSDTTKSAAREMDVPTFLSGDGRRLCADIFAGSMTIQHQMDSSAVCGEAPAPGSLRTTQWARVLLGRTGAPQECFPFDWEMHTGRFTARQGEPLRPAPDRDDARGGAGGGSRADRFRRPPTSAAHPATGDDPEHPGPRTPPLRRTPYAGRHHPVDD